MVPPATYAVNRLNWSTFLRKKLPNSSSTMRRYLPRLSEAAQVRLCRRARSAGASVSALEALMPPHARIEAPFLLGGHQTVPRKLAAQKNRGQARSLAREGAFPHDFRNLAPPGGCVLLWSLARTPPRG